MSDLRPSRNRGIEVNRPSLSVKTNPRPGFSLREHLYNQGVTTTEGVKKHLDFIQKTLSVNPNLDLRRYRVNPNNPNEPMMG